jgi:hypothetical protein
MKTLHVRAEERLAAERAAEAAEMTRQNAEGSLAIELQENIEKFCAEAGIRGIDVVSNGSRVRLQNPSGHMVITVSVAGGKELFTLDSGHEKFNENEILDAILDWLKR